jgi:hypothetical protein
MGTQAGSMASKLELQRPYFVAHPEAHSMSIEHPQARRSPERISHSPLVLQGSVGQGGEGSGVSC